MRLKRFASVFTAVVMLLFAAAFPLAGCENKPNDENRTNVAELFIYEQPDKVAYKVGESFDPSGMTLKAILGDGTSKLILPEECTFSPTGALTDDITEITVAYGGKSVKQKITVVSNETTLGVALLSDDVLPVCIAIDFTKIIKVVVNSGLDSIETKDYTLRLFYIPNESEIEKEPLIFINPKSVTVLEAGSYKISVSVSGKSVECADHVRFGGLTLDSYTCDVENPSLKFSSGVGINLASYITVVAHYVDDLDPNHTSDVAVAYYDIIVKDSYGSSVTVSAGNVHDFHPGSYTVTVKVASTTFGNVLRFTVSNAYTQNDRATAESVAADSIVLLKNENSLLPLDKNTHKRINLFGWNATDNGFILTGGGSGGVSVPREKCVTLTDAFDNYGIEYNEDLIKMYEDYSNYDADSSYNDDGPMLVNPRIGEYTPSVRSGAEAFSDTAVIVLSRFAHECSDAASIVNKQRKKSGVDTSRKYSQLTTEEEELIEYVTRQFDNVIVLVNSCVTMDLSFAASNGIDAALSVGVLGSVGANAIPRILYGDISPSGRVADTYVYDNASAPSYANAFCEVASRDRNLHYNEGIYVGYRWYETADAEGYFDGVFNEYGSGYDGVVQYPFGYGLSYTEFEQRLESLNIHKESGECEARVRVTNRGTFPGKDVVQLYVKPPYDRDGIEKPATELVAFEKTLTLAPAGLQYITLTFDLCDIASYDCYDKNGNGKATYELDAGEYVFYIDDNVHVYDPINTKKLTFTEIQSFDQDAYTCVETTNRFTGKDAYAGVPIDGSTVHGNIEYLSRADFVDTFPIARQSDPDKSFGVNTYKYDGYDNYFTDMPQFGTDNGLYLTDGYGEKYAYNETLISALADYSDPIWDEFLNQITRAEAKQLILKGGFGTSGVESIAMSATKDSDGPSGFRRNVNGENELSLPSPSTIACSWNIVNSFDIGEMQGKAARKLGIDGWYAPSVNIHRTPCGMRNFESYSEDPLLTGKMAAELVRGAALHGLKCYVKHFALNETGESYLGYGAWMTEQTLREIYLKPFEIAIKEGGAAAVMLSINRLGSEWIGANKALVTDILRGEWGFTGTVMTDFADLADYKYMDTARGLRAGTDMWMAPLANLDIDFDDPVDATLARHAVKNIIYGYVKNLENKISA